MGKTVTKERGAASFTAQDLERLQRVADVLAYSPDLQDLLGGDMDARVAFSDTGTGLVFQFEPAGCLR